MKLFNPVVSILCICVVAFGDQEAKLDRIRVFDYGRRAVLSLDNTAILELFLGDSLKHNATSVNVDGKTIVAQFKESSTRLVITQSTDKNLVNYNFAWYTPRDTVYLNDTIYLGGGLTYETHWFGGPQVLQQAWPIQNVQDKKGYDLCPYVSFDIFQRPASGLERFWMSSQKVALVVPSTVPLWTKLSDSSYLSLQAQYKDSPYINLPHRNASEPYLEYTLIVPQSFESVTLPEFYLALAEKYLDRPTSMFDEKLIEKPIWTTWARYGINVTQDDVTSFANEIVDRGFAISQLELDDMWTPAYGDYEIDTEKFPDFKTMINNLGKKNIRLTAWVHPFINTNAKNGNDVALREYFVKGSDNQAEIVTWWDGEAYVLDMTNSDARNWFTKQLTRRVSIPMGSDSHVL